MVNEKTDSSAAADFSTLYPGVAYNVTARQAKADKILAILEDYFFVGLNELSAIDIGCSTGIITSRLGMKFKLIVGIDVDQSAIQFAAKHFSTSNTSFAYQDGAKLDFPDSSFDVVVCAHVYEHVADPNRLMDEIHRILKPNGICYFAAGNRLCVIEPHYHLPFLSVVPRVMANLYLRITGKGSRYEERLQLYWGLRKLVRQYELIDY